MKGYKKEKALKLFHNDKLITSECYKAESFVQRLCGLITVPYMEENEVLFFEGSCQQMHSLFMRYPLDLVFLSKEKRVVAQAPLRPWRFSKFHLKAAAVLEFPQGSILKHQIKLNDHFEVRS